MLNVRRLDEPNNLLRSESKIKQTMLMFTSNSNMFDMYLA